jgi:hypothetical protein
MSQEKLLRPAVQLRSRLPFLSLAVTEAHRRRLQVSLPRRCRRRRLLKVFSCLSASSQLLVCSYLVRSTFGQSLIGAPFILLSARRRHTPMVGGLHGARTIKRTPARAARELLHARVTMTPRSIDAGLDSQSKPTREYRFRFFGGSVLRLVRLGRRRTVCFQGRFSGAPAFQFPWALL